MNPDFKSIVAEEVEGFEAIHGQILPSTSLLENNYQQWLTTLLPAHFRGLDQFAPHQDEFWQWGWAVQPNERGCKRFCVNGHRPVE
jgi:hypothetical protein